MRSKYGNSLLCAFGLVLCTTGAARADLGVYLNNLNISAEASIGDFRTQVGVQYGTPIPTLDLVFRSVATPADAVVVFWLGQRCSAPVETVLRVYQEKQGQGWGEIAKSLGIKPGSADFHALKAGNLGWQPASGGRGEGAGNGGKGGGKGNGKGKGKK